MYADKCEISFKNITKKHLTVNHDISRQNTQICMVGFSELAGKRRYRVVSADLVAPQMTLSCGFGQV